MRPGVSENVVGGKLIESSMFAENKQDPPDSATIQNNCSVLNLLVHSSAASSPPSPSHSLSLGLSLPLSADTLMNDME